MIRNTVLTALNFYYPLGNTPALCLTADLPPELSANILLLGCGDWRHILFTCYVDPGRKLDITCNDIEPDILARNVLLLSLILLAPPPSTPAECDDARSLDASEDASKDAMAKPKAKANAKANAKAKAKAPPKYGKSKNGSKAKVTPIGSNSRATAFERGNDGLTEGDELVWEIWFHQRLTDKALAVLEAQARCLIAWSETVESWEASPLGKRVRFCDTTTRGRLRQCWQQYVPPSTESRNAVASGNDLRRWERRLAKSHQDAYAMMKERVGNNSVFSGSMSAAPAQCEAFSDMDSARIFWWKTGTTFSEDTPLRLNPTFFALTRAGLLLHYGQEPLADFPSAFNYLPLQSDEYLASSSTPASTKAPAFYRLVRSCRRMFSLWTAAARAADSASNLVIRVSTADAARLCATFVHARETSALGKPEYTANLPCDFLTMRPLTLLEGEYRVSEGQLTPAPLTFDVIDTSNVLDYAGGWHVLPVAAQLLRKNIAATLHIESLVHVSSAGESQIGQRFGVDLCTVGLLLGLVLVEQCTNSTTMNEENLFYQAMTKLNEDDVSQRRRQLRWKPFLGDSEKVRIETGELVGILIKIFHFMFHHESVKEITLNFARLVKEPQVPYSRSSFANLLRVLSRTVEADWTANGVPESIYQRIATGPWDSVVNFNYIQELLLALHLAGLRTNQLDLAADLALCFRTSPLRSLFSKVPVSNRVTSRNEVMIPGLGPVPIELAVTVQIPASVLSKVAEQVRAGKVPQPTFELTLIGGNQTSNSTLCIQAAFGQIVDKNQNGRSIESYLIVQAPEMAEEGFGESDLILSAYFLTATILFPDTRLVCGWLSTLQGATGKQLPPRFHTVPITDPSVYVTRYPPEMTGYPFNAYSKNSLSISNPSLKDKVPKSAPFKPTFKAKGNRTGSLDAVIAKVDLRSEGSKDNVSILFAAQTLGDPTSKIEVDFENPFVSEIRMTRSLPQERSLNNDAQGIRLTRDVDTGGESSFVFPIVFPLPVDHTNHKLRIARKSLYIELEAPFRSHLAPVHSHKSCLISPTFMTHGNQPLGLTPAPSLTRMGVVPVPYTNRRLRLDKLPRVDLTEVHRCKPLAQHLSCGGCPFEHKERNKEELAKKTGVESRTSPNLRVDIDITLTFMLKTMIEHPHSVPIFGLAKKEHGVKQSVEIWVLPAALRLDLLNHTVVMDAATIVCTEEMRHLGQTSLVCLRGAEGYHHLELLPEELLCWKALLPSMVERCRDYNHTEKCEYLKGHTGDLQAQTQRVTALKLGWHQRWSTPLCSCGLGRFPPDYFHDPSSESSAKLDEVFQKCAHRCAIGPLFAAAIVEDKQLQKDWPADQRNAKNPKTFPSFPPDLMNLANMALASSRATKQTLSGALMEHARDGRPMSDRDPLVQAHALLSNSNPRKEDMIAMARNLFELKGGCARECDTNKPRNKPEIVEATGGMDKATERDRVTLANACANCRLANAPLLNCGRCKNQRYCSAACQRSHWPQHKLTCTPDH